MRLHCTVLVAIAVAIVSTNALDDTDGKERMFSPFRYEKLPKAGPSTTPSGELSKLEKEFEETAIIHDPFVMFMKNDLQTFKEKVEAINAKHNTDLRDTYAIKLMRDHFKDRDIVVALASSPVQYEKVKIDFFKEWMRPEKSLKVPFVKRWAAGMELSSELVKDYIAAIEKAKTLEGKIAERSRLERLYIED